MKFNLVFDNFVNGNPYPNLAPVIDISNGYELLWTTFPRTLPIRLFYYFKCFNFPFEVFHIDQDFPQDSFYPIGIAWFDFSIDYIGILPQSVKDKIQQGKLRLLFYYHEGDNPRHEFNYLNAKCRQHNLPLNYVFVTGNTATQDYKNFIHFADHELFYYKANLQHSPIQISPSKRDKDFTALNRVHKWWRATVMSHLVHSQLLENSYWSYGSNTVDDQIHNNPINIGALGLGSTVAKFVEKSPYVCDDLNSTQHNTHSVLVEEHFSNSYVHLVLETFFDIEQSNGTFLSEKTFKPIKHGQPFVLIAPPGSLALLRSMGYRTFDNVFDNSYDTVVDNTSRWLAIYKLIKWLKKQNLHEIYLQCQDDITHNQKHFVTCGYSRLQTLWKNLYEQSSE